MPVNIDIKGNLAKLLATENLIVEHKKVETASFNTESRVLTLPMWDTSNFVYDMLVAHEVGHALFTPSIDWKQGKYANLPMDYVNVVEDARIERLMKQKYAGLNRDFYKGYEELNANDFFEIDGKILDNFKLIDKINLYFKVGAYLCIDFNDTENQFITEITQAETFDQILDISLRIYEYTKEEAKKVQVVDVDLPLSPKSASIDGKQDDSGKGDDDTETEANADSKQGEDNDADGNSEAKSDLNSSDESDNDDDLEGDRSGGVTGGDWDNIDQSDTQKAFDYNADDLKDENAIEKTYLNIPDLKLDNIVIPFDVIHKQLQEHFRIEREDKQDPRQYGNRFQTIEDATKDFFEYKRSASKDVNHLVKEFECKKSADSYARQAISKTGILDTSKLHTYLYNDDIFRKVTTIPEGKNHGLVFLLDWSGSMNMILENTLKQLFNLVWFCKKVNIPFEVYAFTNDSWVLNKPDANMSWREDRSLDNVKTANENDIAIDATFRMVNILSSKIRSKDNEEMMLNLFLQAKAMRYTLYRYDRTFALSGTPLNEAIISIGELSKLFIKSNKIQKCHVVVLTDGEGQHSNYHSQYTDYDGDKRMRNSYIHANRVAIRKNGKVFTPDGYSDAEFTSKLVEVVKSDLPHTSFIGIRILERGGLRHFYENYGRTSFDFYEDVQTQSKKQGAVFFKTRAFDLMCGINQNAIHASDDLEVEQGAEKRAISNAFKKMNRSKKSNKFMVKEFIKQIA